MVSSSAQALAVTEDDEPRVEPRQGGFTGTYRLLVRGKNINQNTLLATDYLNHFNEIIMLLEMVPSMPECYRNAVEWRPNIGRASCRDRVCQYVSISVVAVSLKKKKQKKT